MRKPKYEPGQDREMMLDADEWPQWPFLPVKKSQDAFADGNMGVMISTNEQRNIVYLTNLYQPLLETCERAEYESVDALLADGWIVD